MSDYSLMPQEVRTTAVLYADAYFKARFSSLEHAIGAAIMADRNGRYSAFDVSGLTARQRDAYLFIRDYVGEKKVAPSYTEIGDHLGLRSKSGIHRLVYGLAERGAISVIPGRARAIRLNNCLAVEQ